MSVHVFPLAYRQSLVHKIARELCSLNSGSADKYWRDTAKRLLVDLGETGIPREEAEQQVRLLFFAVLETLKTTKVWTAKNCRKTLDNRQRLEKQPC